MEPLRGTSVFHALVSYKNSTSTKLSALNMHSNKHKFWLFSKNDWQYW